MPYTPIVKVVSPNVHYDESLCRLEASYDYSRTTVQKDGNSFTVSSPQNCEFGGISSEPSPKIPIPIPHQVMPVTNRLSIRTDCRVPKLGVMLVGWGGNNGSTLTATMEANHRKLRWRTRTGEQQANWFGSLTQASTVLLGSDADGRDVFAPMKDLLPMVESNSIGECVQIRREFMLRCSSLESIRSSSGRLGH